MTLPTMYQVYSAASQNDLPSLRKSSLKPNHISKKRFYNDLVMWEYWDECYSTMIGLVHAQM